MLKVQAIRRKGYLPDQIVTEIMAQISGGSVKPGDQLPTEHALAESFGVSRNVVREAIARLRSDGVIESKQGRGATVSPRSARTSFKVEVESLSDQDNLLELFELRGLLEIQAAGLAARRRTYNDLQVLRSALDDMAGDPGFDEKRLEADAQFHRCLGAATGNGYLTGITDYISGRLKETIRATDAVYPYGNLVEVTLYEHRTIFFAVERGDSAAAQTAMAAHINGAAKRLGLELKHQL